MIAYRYMERLEYLSQRCHSQIFTYLLIVMGGEAQSNKHTCSGLIAVSSTSITTYWHHYHL